MWDAWATYDPVATGYFVTEKHVPDDLVAARDESISYAAYTVLSARFQNAVGSEESLAEFDAVLRASCYPTTPRGGDTASAVGVRIGKAVLARALDDGANEANGYESLSYVPVNAPLTVSGLGTRMVDPNRWQPLRIIDGITQNGIPTGSVQVAIGPQWGHVQAFGPSGSPTDGLLVDPGPPPRVGDPATDAVLKEQLVDLIRRSSELDPRAQQTIDISPGAIGANSLGANDGHGRPMNPSMREPYTPNIVSRGDFDRVLAEFWADGPKSETPPGHWNVIANLVSDALDPDLHIGGSGPVIDRLEWDVKLYLALNGAVHNAAVAAWGLKDYYDTSRPISLIRYMGGRGQSSDPKGPSYDREGLPLVPGLIEVITLQSSAPGQRHARLAKYVGRIAIRAWGGSPANPVAQIGGAHWILAMRWVPYQRPTFVTPSFPGYISGHSTFSRAAAEVLAAFTGTPYFPGGIGGYTIPAGSLKFEKGPTTDIDLQWATYFDASDQAGISRLFGGIHIQADDLAGRVIGSACGKAAWALARSYFAGSVIESQPACSVPVRAWRSG